MRDGWIKVACASPKITVADVRANVREICKIEDQKEVEQLKEMYFVNKKTYEGFIE